MNVPSSVHCDASHPSSSRELALRGTERVLSGHVERAGGHFPTEAIEGRAVLADHADLVALVDREYRDRAEVGDHVALEGRAVVLDRSLLNAEDVGLQELLGSNDAERLAHNVASTDSGSMMWGSRPSARAAAALMRPRKSGCGRSGRDLNSGWACVPT